MTTNSEQANLARVVAASASESGSEDVVGTGHVPLDIDDPAGRFGDWMPGDDPDDWR